jgi:hypothetical protein
MLQVETLLYRESDDPCSSAVDTSCAHHPTLAIICFRWVPRGKLASTTSRESILIDITSIVVLGHSRTKSIARSTRQQRIEDSLARSAFPLRLFYDSWISTSHPLLALLATISEMPVTRNEKIRLNAIQTVTLRKNSLTKSRRGEPIRECNNTMMKNDFIL